jgi:transposase
MIKDSPPQPTLASTEVVSLPDTLAGCHLLIAQQAEQLHQLCQQLNALQERANLNSHNSSKPPSSNGPGAPGKSGGRKKSERKRGAQPGHRGHSRSLVDESRVDVLVPCEPASQCECGVALVCQDQPTRHQVFDVPAVQAHISEYQIFSARCAGCGKAHRGVLPARVPAGQIGPKALALVGVLSTKFHLTQGKIRHLLDELLGIRFSIGAVSQAHGKVSEALTAPAAQLHAAIKAQAVKHLDETRYPQEGHPNHWAWAVVTPQMVSYTLLPSTARYVAHDLIGEKPHGVVVSDRYSVYGYVQPQQRQVCWAHLLRDFQRISERSGEPGRIGKALTNSGHVLFRWHHQGRAASAFEPLQRRIKRYLDMGQQSQCKRTAATCQNLLKLWPALWTFLDNPQVPPTNNAAEQALRTLVIKRKISGPTRSKRGNEFLARGFSVSETCLRQGKNLWQYLHHAVSSWIKGLSPESLVPQAVPSG